MANFFILGSSNAIPDLQRENTYFLIENGASCILVDCGANALMRLSEYKISPDAVSDLIITHFHPDHVAGLPLLLMDWWLLGRTAPLTIYGLEDTLEKTKMMMALFSWKDWPGFFPVHFHSLIETMQDVLKYPDVQIRSIAVKHLIPTLGLRFQLNQGSRTIAYTCDTEPCSQVIELAKGADVLIHECAGAEKGHSSAAQCGEDARDAGIKELYLIHYPADAEPGTLIRDAGKAFSGKITLAVDHMKLA